jgi:hypothetical protein
VARADGDTTYDYQDGYQPAEREGFSSPLHVRDASEVPVQQRDGLGFRAGATGTQ